MPLTLTSPRKQGEGIASALVESGQAAHSFAWAAAYSGAIAV
jgi:hypothetical protein